MLRILHTSDWHLGQRLHDLPREREHEAFLAWLLDTLEAEEVDALLVCGDVFDTANPPTAALRAWYGFLAETARRRPALEVVVIGGNHDSATRLDAPREVLHALRVRVVGGLPRREDRTVDTDRLTVALHDRTGREAALVAAVPYLRLNDLSATAATDGDVLIDGVRRVYEEAVGAIRARRTEDQALIVTAHCYMTGTRLSEQSERKILLGNLHALPVSVFPDDVTYAALGHLHLAQKVGGLEHVRYAGSPIPLSLAEARYTHQVCLVDIDDQGALAGVRSLPVPRRIELLRIPETGHAPWEEVLPALEALPERTPAHERELLPILEVAIALPHRQPGLRGKLAEALQDRAVRLARFTVALADADDGDGPADQRELTELDPEELLIRRYREEKRRDPEPGILALFAELVEAVHQGAGE